MLSIDIGVTCIILVSAIKIHVVGYNEGDDKITANQWRRVAIVQH